MVRFLALFVFALVVIATVASDPEVTETTLDPEMLPNASYAAASPPVAPAPVVLPPVAPSAPVKTSAPVAAKPVPQTLYLTGDRVRLRAGPSTDDAILGTLTRGTSVTFQGRSGDWAQIETPLGSGWMFAQYLGNDAPREPAPAGSNNAASPAVDRTSAIQAILRRSQASYSGSCPCPFNRDRAGRLCGGRSAYSRPGGASPLCYAGDVSSRQVEAFLRQAR